MAGELVFYFVSGPALLNWVEMLAREEIKEAPWVATHLLGLILLTVFNLITIVLLWHEGRRLRMYCCGPSLRGGRDRSTNRPSVAAE
ncbi:hypothetical protein [Thioclava sp. F34-6]|uniref:hypothetical protein n=1 Tax=Thioclava sp. F34-6 TaxID=1973003 RepID=UPI000B548453|nr:hypothetical protein [Thioclava sp. F34-6]